MSSFVRVGNKKKDILILDEGPKLGLDDITLIAEKNIQLILLKITKNCLRFHYNGANIYLLMVQKLLN